MSSGHRFLYLDALRGLAAVGVVLYHRREIFPGMLLGHAYLAVDFFFLLSGFVVAYAYEHKILAGFGFRNFLVARIVRLLPLIILGASFGLSVETMKAFADGNLTRFTNALLAFPFAFFSLPNPSSVGSKPFLLNDPTWSLFFEVCVNVVYAAIVPFLGAKVLKWIVLISGLALVAVALQNQGVRVGQDFSTLWLGFVRVTFPFFFGVTLFRMSDKGYFKGIKIPNLALGVVLLAFLLFPLQGGMADAFFDLVAITLVFPTVIAIGSIAIINNKSHWAFLMAGEISYALYIIHVPLLNALDYPLSWLNTSMSTRIAVYLGVIVPAAYFATRWYDKPIQRLAKERLRLGVYRSARNKPAD